VKDLEQHKHPVPFPSSDVKKRKRGGYRLIYFWKAGELKVYLLGEKAEITKKEIEALLKRLSEELG